MAFTSSFDKVRKIGRKIVLPIDEIKEQVIMNIPTVSGNILDLGAGTMYWSEWLNSQYKTKILAVDTFYKDNFDLINSFPGGVVQYNDYFRCIEVNEIKMIWMCDVIHHLEESFITKLLDSIIEKKISIIVIKDIDCGHKFGNFMNKVHDFVINHEKIHDVHSGFFGEWLQSNGYKVSFRYMPKLWYPHFMLIGIKNH